MASCYFDLFMGQSVSKLVFYTQSACWLFYLSPETELDLEKVECFYYEIKKQKVYIL